MPPIEFSSYNELDPVPRNRFPGLRGVIDSVNAKRENEGFYTYTVTARHPRGGEMELLQVREGVQPFYRAQGKQYRYKDVVFVQKNSSGHWEITGAEQVPGGFTAETAMNIGIARQPLGGLTMNENTQELQLGDVDLVNTPESFTLATPGWTETYEGRQWEMTNGAIRFRTIIEGPDGNKYAVYIIQDPTRRPTDAMGIPAEDRLFPVAARDPRSNNLRDAAIQGRETMDGWLMKPVFAYNLIQNSAIYDPDNPDNDGLSRNLEIDGTRSKGQWNTGISATGFNDSGYIIGWTPDDSAYSTLFKLAVSSTSPTPGDITAARSPAAADASSWGPPDFRGYQVTSRRVINGAAQADVITTKYIWRAPYNRRTANTTPRSVPPSGLPQGWDDTWDQITYYLNTADVELTQDADIDTFFAQGWPLSGFKRLRTLTSDHENNTENNILTIVLAKPDIKLAAASAAVAGGLFVAGPLATVFVGGLSAASLTAVMATGTAAEVGLTGLATIPFVASAVAASAFGSTAAGAAILAGTGIGVAVAGAGVGGQVYLANEINSNVIEAVDVNGIQMYATHPTFGQSRVGTWYFPQFRLKNGFEFVKTAST